MTDEEGRVNHGTSNQNRKFAVEISALDDEITRLYEREESLIKELKEKMQSEILKKEEKIERRREKMQSEIWKKEEEILKKEEEMEKKIERRREEILKKEEDVKSEIKLLDVDIWKIFELQDKKAEKSNKAKLAFLEKRRNNLRNDLAKEKDVLRNDIANYEKEMRKVLEAMRIDQEAMRKDLANYEGAMRKELANYEEAMQKEVKEFRATYEGRRRALQKREGRLPTSGSASNVSSGFLHSQDLISYLSNLNGATNHRVFVGEDQEWKDQCEFPLCDTKVFAKLIGFHEGAEGNYNRLFNLESVSTQNDEKPLQSRLNSHLKDACALDTHSGKNQISCPNWMAPRTGKGGDCYITKTGQPDLTSCVRSMFIEVKAKDVKNFQFNLNFLT